MRQTTLWFLQLVTGALTFVFLGIHMAMMHIDSVLAYLGIQVHNPTSWASMIERARDGTWLAFYILLLVLIVYHGLYGLRTIVLEIVGSPRAESALNWAFVLLGIAAVALGTYVPVKLF
jgi:succinate dehydrogenase hydrophobic anchor subunit